MGMHKGETAEPEAQGLGLGPHPSWQEDDSGAGESGFEIAVEASTAARWSFGGAERDETDFHENWL